MEKSISSKAVVLITGMFLLIFAYKARANEVVLEKSAEVQVERAGVNITARLHAGHLAGEANEYVYDGGHTLSQLIWKIDDIYMIGAGVSVKPLYWLSINADIWFNIGDGSSTMDDYDWIKRGCDWTDWSHHKNTDVTRGIMVDINVELTPFKAGPVRFSGLLGYRQDNWKWEARGGSYVYSVDGLRDRSDTWPDDEPGITYEQIFNVPYIGIGVNGNFGIFDLKARLIGSPFFYGEAIDHHHKRDLVVYDDFIGKSMVAFDIAGAYTFTNHLVLQIAFNYTKYDTMKGDSEYHYNDIGIVITHPDAAGIDLETSMFSLSFLYTF